MSGALDLTNVSIEDTYQRLIQTDGVYLYDGTGSLFNISGAISPGGSNTQIQYNNSGEFDGVPNLTWDGTTLRATGSFTGSFTGSLFGTASYALNGGVTQLLAGSNITLSPTTGKGQVTISSTGGSGGQGNTSTGSYGSFYDTTTQTNPVANIPRSMSLNTTDITNGVSISGSTNPFNTYIKTENAGVYDIQFSAQIEKTDSGTDEIVIWLRKNNINLTDTATKLTLVGNNTKVVAAWNWFVNSAANDYYQIIWQSADTGMRLYAEPANSTPGIPSVIVTANRVDQFLSNTGSFSGSFTGHLIGTASFATSSSRAVSASFAQNALIASSAQNALIASSVNTLNQDLIISDGYKIYISSPATPSAGISSYSKPISQLTVVGAYSGETIKGFAGQRLYPGELIYLYTDGLWYKADATPDSTNGPSSATSLLGMLVGSVTAEINDNIVVLLQGMVYTDSIVYSIPPEPGVPLWAGTTPGTIEISEPSTSGNVVRQVGRTITSNVIRFAPDNYFSIIQ
jgi:hypothetical protein